MTYISRVLAFLAVAFLGPSVAMASSDLMSATCAKVAKPGYHKEPDDELPYFCHLPARVKKNVPDLYWMLPDQYEKWLDHYPTKPASTLNLGKNEKESHVLVNGYVLDPNACHIYSSISPSVQKKAAYVSGPRTKVVLDEKDLLRKCREFKKEFKAQGVGLCSVIEFAGHATQSVGLDTVFGIDEKDGKKVITPSAGALTEIGKCLRSISQPKAVIVFSTCGGDKIQAKDGSWGPTHYWSGKESAQKELAQIFQMPLISGIGFVDGTPDGGVTCDDGWHLSQWKKTAPAPF